MQIWLYPVSEGERANWNFSLLEVDKMYMDTTGASFRMGQARVLRRD